MLTRRDAAAEVNDRPYNNLLRRLNRADFALIEPYLSAAKCGPNDLLYNPGQDVETVHFPCGASLVSYIVPNEDGRDVETILIGREGAVGGIVSHGYLPAYTRICVKFAGPFVRLPISKLEAAKASRQACAIFSRAMPIACWRRCFSRPPATRCIRSSSAPPNGSSRPWSAPKATTSCR